MIQAEQLHARILEELDLSRDIPDEELTELIHRVLDEASGREYIPLGKKAELGRELFNAFRKFDLLQEFLEDDKITEIMINGTENIFLEKEGKLIRSGKRLLSRRRAVSVRDAASPDSLPKHSQSTPPSRSSTATPPAAKPSAELSAAGSGSSSTTFTPQSTAACARTAGSNTAGAPRWT